VRVLQGGEGGGVHATVRLNSSRPGKPHSMDDKMHNRVSNHAEVLLPHVLLTNNLLTPEESMTICSGAFMMQQKRRGSPL